MDEIERRKLLMKIQKPFNPETLTPNVPLTPLEGMTDYQRKLFEEAVGVNAPKKPLMPQAPELSAEELKAISDQFNPQDVKPPVDISEEPPKRFKKLLSK